MVLPLQALSQQTGINALGVAGLAGGEGTLASGVTLVSLGCNGYVLTDLTEAIVKGSTSTTAGDGYGCHILNNSYGVFYKNNLTGKENIKTLTAAVTTCFKNHCVFIASRGNREKDDDPSENTRVEYPACTMGEHRVLNVGASGIDGRRKLIDPLGDDSYESKYGSDVDVIGPGSLELIATTWADGVPINPTAQILGTTKYARFNGTSSAAPCVAGLAALMLSQHVGGNYPNTLDDGDIHHLIKVNSNNVGGEPWNEVGEGLINVAATMQKVDLDQGYFVLHSKGRSTLNSSSILNIQSDVQVNLVDHDFSLDADHIYKADLYKVVSTWTVQLPAFCSNATEVINGWVTHNAGVNSTYTTLNASTWMDIQASVVGNTVQATTTTYGWYLKKRKNFLGLFFDVSSPAFYPTTMLDGDFSMLVHDPNATSGLGEKGKVIFKVAIHPNPATDLFTLSFVSQAPATGSVIVLDAVGKEMSRMERLQIETGKNDVSLSAVSYPAGFYNVVLHLNGQTFTSKLVIIK